MKLNLYEFDLQELMRAKGQSEQLEMAISRIRFEEGGEEIYTPYPGSILPRMEIMELYEPLNN
jgi:hypothetical protein